jgi:hypothetical protein
MKKILLSMALISVFMSCKKSNSSSGPHMTANVGGTAKTFNTSVLATKLGSGGAMAITVAGFASSNKTEAFTLQLDNLSSGDAITAKTYADTSSGYNITCTYINSSLGQYIGNNVTWNDALAVGVTVKNHTKVVITSIDSTSISGTFSGDLFPNADVSQTPTTVTSGDFYAKFQ